MKRTEYREACYEFPFVAYTGAESGEKQPLIIQLHGAGERGDGNDELVLVDKNGFSKYLEDAERACVVVMPQCPKDSFWAAHVESIVRFVYQMMEKFNADPNRVYLTGLSMGGYGTWFTAMDRPDLFAAIAPVCGGGMAWNAAALTMPIWTCHGIEDETVSVNQSDEMVAKLRTLGRDVTYERLEGYGHNVWDYAYTERLMDWLLSKKRGITVGTKSVIEFWYKKLNFPSRYDGEFYRALEEIEIPADSKLEDYDPKCEDGKRNLLTYLYFCEELKRRYAEKGIGEDILMDTLSDLVVWTDVWSELKGELWLGELHWLNFHLGMRLFKLGRLQFCLGKAKHDAPAHGLVKGDTVVEVHIPAVGPLKQEDCVRSVARAQAFFAMYYPEHTYRCFTCHSWLMDKKLDEVLPADSNIIRFRNRFDIVHEQPSDAILKYAFKWNTTVESLDHTPATSGFAQRVKEHRLAGEMFNESLGIWKE